MLWALLSIAVIFLLSLGLKSFIPKLCPLCLAVSSTWIIGIVFNFDPLVISMLMGGSAVGFLYYLGGRVPENYLVFKLPYLLTAFVLIYFTLVQKIDSLVVVTLLGLWVVFITLFVLKDTGAKKWFKKVVECCKNW